MVLYSGIQQEVYYPPYVCMYICIHALATHVSSDNIFRVFSTSMIVFYVCMYVCMYVSS